MSKSDLKRRESLFPLNPCRKLYFRSSLFPSFVSIRGVYLVKCLFFFFFPHPLRIAVEFFLIGYILFYSCFVSVTRPFATKQQLQLGWTPLLWPYSSEMTRRWCGPTVGLTVWEFSFTYSWIANSFDWISYWSLIFPLFGTVMHGMWKHVGKSVVISFAL